MLASQVFHSFRNYPLPSPIRENLDQPWAQPIQRFEPPKIFLQIFIVVFVCELSERRRPHTLKKKFVGVTALRVVTALYSFYYLVSNVSVVTATTQGSNPIGKNTI